MRALWIFALGAALGCATTTPYHSCESACGSGERCDTLEGICRADPCEGRCTRWERCEAGPPSHCVIVPMSEMEVTRPDTSSPSNSLH